MISQFVSLSPTSGPALTVWSLLGILSLSAYLSARPPPSLSLSLSLSLSEPCLPILTPPLVNIQSFNHLSVLVQTADCGGKKAEEKKERLLRKLEQ